MDSKRHIAIKALAEYAQEIRDQITQQTRELTSELQRVEEILRILDGGETTQRQQPSALQSFSGEFSNIGAQAAVEKVLREHPKQIFSLTEIVSCLTQRGFHVPNPRLLRQQVLIALLRAVRKKNIVLEVTSDGKRSFQWKALP